MVLPTVSVRNSYGTWALLIYLSRLRPMPLLRVLHSGYFPALLSAFFLRSSSFSMCQGGKNGLIRINPIECEETANPHLGPRIRLLRFSFGSREQHIICSTFESVGIHLLTLGMRQPSIRSGACRFS